MRRAIAPLLFLVFVVACQGDGPTNPTEEFEAFDLVAALRGPPDLSGLLPELERRVFIHYRAGFAQPEGRGKKPPKEKEETSLCFSFLANGAAWNAPEPYVTTFELPTATWDDVAKRVGADIFGDEELVGSVPAFTGDLDEVNSAQFGDYPNADVIAVTVVWGVFRGPPGQRRLVEWDILMNDASFTFGDADLDNFDLKYMMDTENIMVHELGHAAGLGHAPNDCTDMKETMYAFASAGETIKRTLEDDDEQGVVELYQ